MLFLFKFIIQRMLEVYKRSWQVFFPIFASLVLGAVGALILLDGKTCQNPVLILVGILAVVAFVIGIIAYISDIKDGLRKDRERKREEVRKALREAAKSLSPTGTEYTDEQLDTWMNGI